MSSRSINTVVGWPRRAARSSLHRLDEHRGLPTRTFEEQRYRRETYARPAGRPVAYEMRRPRMSRNAAFRNCGTPSNVIFARSSAERSACDACDASSLAHLSPIMQVGRSSRCCGWRLVGLRSRLRTLAARSTPPHGRHAAAPSHHVAGLAGAASG